MDVTDSGLVRLTLDELLSLPMRHLFSGLDAGPTQPLVACGRATTISGYTEWASLTALPVSLGWDWELRISGVLLRWTRSALPRTNVQIVDRHGRDLPWMRNLESLATVVDSLSWVQQALRAISFSGSREHPYQFS